MKAFIKVILPPVIAFWAFAVFIKFTPYFHHVEGLGQLGEDSVYGLISYYKIFAPVQILIALLTQWLIFIPLWNRILNRPASAIMIFIVLLFVCLLFAFGIAYIIWDKAMGISHLVDTCLFMTGVQLFYWITDFMVLYLIDWKAFKSIPATDKEAEQ